MKQRWTAVLAAVVLSAVVSTGAWAQSGTGVKQDKVSGSELRQNSPNPFLTETRIPFTVGDFPKCSEPNRVYRISLRVYNILSQLVAVPVLQGGAGSVADGTPLQNIEMTCGQYTAYWDAKHLKTKQDVAPGIYIYVFEVDKRPLTLKMIKGGSK